MELDLAVGLYEFAFEGLLEADVAAILLAEQGADYGGFVAAESMACYVV